MTAKTPKMKKPDARQLRKFFEKYASLQDKPEALAALYAPNFIAGGPDGSMSYANDARFIEWLKGMRAFNMQAGMHSIAPASVRAVALSSAHVLATVKWGARFARTGKRRITFRISYLLENLEGGWKVLAYISEADQQKEMKRLGIS